MVLDLKPTLILVGVFSQLSFDGIITLSRIILLVSETVWIARCVTVVRGEKAREKLG